ncbi:hypothetical protein BGX33_000955, partial [Mortierella sp. NVP41]
HGAGFTSRTVCDTITEITIVNAHGGLATLVETPGFAEYSADILGGWIEKYNA